MYVLGMLGTVLPVGKNGDGDDDDDDSDDDYTMSCFVKKLSNPTLLEIYRNKIVLIQPASLITSQS